MVTCSKLQKNSQFVTKCYFVRYVLLTLNKYTRTIFWMIAFSRRLIQKHPFALDCFVFQNEIKQCSSIDVILSNCINFCEDTRYEEINVFDILLQKKHFIVCF